MKKIIITTGVLAVAGGVVTALTMSSCDHCEVDEKPSVIVTLVDQGAPDGGIAHVSADEFWYDYTNEDGEVVREQATCLNPDEGCTDWQLGTGQPGDYAYQAKVCGKEFSSSVTLEFNDEGCEVDTRIIDLEVTTFDCPDLKAPEPPTSEPPQAPTTPEIPPWKSPNNPNCTLEARFSVVASAWTEVDGRMIPLALDRAFYIHNPSEDGDHGKGKGHEIGEGEGHDKAKGKGHHKHEGDEELPGICLDRQCTRFAAGVELPGTFVVGGEACNQSVEATVEVSMTDDGCHVEPQYATLQFDSSMCPKPPEVPAAPGHTPVYDAVDPKLEVDLAACDGYGRTPTAYLMPIVQEGDMLRPYPTSGLTYVQRSKEEIKTEAFCAVPTSDGRCSLYIAGYGISGDFRAYTTACGIESSVVYSVERTENMCAPITAWVPLSVDTRGCIQSPSPQGNPPPETVAEGTDVTK